jgi:hemerythrin superfamily protein
MDAIDLLVKHHRELEKRFEDLLECAPQDRRPSFIEAADLLAAHFTIEEESFYPAVSATRTEDILLESLEEHLSLKRVLADLLALDVNEQTFEPKLHVLKEQAQHHHKEEEDHLFPKVKKLLDADAREALGTEMQAMLDRLARSQPRKMVAGQTQEAAPLPPKI